MKFIKQIAPILNSEYQFDDTLLSNHHREILSHILSEPTFDSKQGKDLYYNGKKSSWDHAISRINITIQRFIAAHYNPKMNEYQLKRQELRMRADCAISLLDHGHRNIASTLAIDIYHAAKKYHIHLISFQMAELVSNDAAQFEKNIPKSKKWRTLAKTALRLVEFKSDFFYNHALLLSSSEPVQADDVRAIIDITIQEDTWTGCMFSAYALFALKCYYAEITQDWSLLLSEATQGYQYFQDLYFNHRAAKCAMIANIIHANNRLRQYKKSTSWKDTLLTLSDARANFDLAIFRLMQSYLNKCKPHKGLTVLKELKGYPIRPQIQKLLDIAQQYCYLQTGSYGSIDTSKLPSSSKDPLYIHTRLINYTTHLLIDIHDINFQEEGKIYAYRHKGTRRAELISLLCHLPSYHKNSWSKKESANLSSLNTMEQEVEEREILDYNILYNIAKSSIPSQSLQLS